MTKADLRPGYVVRMRNGEVALLCAIAPRENTIAMVLTFADSNDGSGWMWCPVENYNENLTNKDYDRLFNAPDRDIVEVYGYCMYAHKVLDFSHPEAYRPLLWKRSEPKKMTVKEICEALGYDVEIVKEAPNA